MERIKVETPAFVYDEARIDEDCMRVARIARDSGCRLLFALKASSIAGALEVVGRHVDGFSVSSLFENLLVKKIFGGDALVHTTSPGLRAQDLRGIAGSSQYLSCNSVSQLERFAPDLGHDVRLGIRANPGLSLLSDARYDPCRPHSKLGASPEEIAALVENSPELAKRLGGLLVHNNCDAEDFSGLLRTVRHLDVVLADILPSLTWINLGGGYSFRSDECLDQFAEAVAHLQSRYDLDIFIEPGAALVRGGVTLVASVVDLFERDGQAIAVLDGTVNHVPEVFEYQDVADNEPWVSGHVDNGRFAYLLAGSSCLAGDVFGDYAFDSPLAIGDQISFPEMGAYAFAKAHWFNGINLPNIYAKSADGQTTLKQQFTFADFAHHNGMEQRGGWDATVSARV
jgi:carboxynorspermidine decarboxylase